MPAAQSWPQTQTETKDPVVRYIMNFVTASNQITVCVSRHCPDYKINKSIILKVKQAVKC